MGSRAILQHIQVRRAALLDLNGHPSLVLHNVLALHSDDLCMPEYRVGWAGCHLHCKLILALATHMVVVMPWFLFLLCICMAKSYHGVIISTLQYLLHAKSLSWHSMAECCQWHCANGPGHNENWYQRWCCSEGWAMQCWQQCS